MAKLSCSVNNCCHNSSNYCCNNEIKVGGKKANSPSSTCCESFQEMTEAFTNNVQTPNPSLNVKCEATNCIHNSDCSCSANSISIDGISASNSDDTQCVSFAKK